jgi:hypothetical protein
MIMENLMDFKIIVDYAFQEVKKLEGSKISCPKEYELVQNNYKAAKNLFIRKMNEFLFNNSALEIHFSEKD